ncbi:protein FAM184B [Microcaecilia unicolor]|uniref:Protein FAM184B n=1 Tax=Microcaecilia unicolor TaxID=1415580 RepID=A0A6P7XD12_9AMPH|nr:protein FAM184B [Microcaecilia unicolor]
MKMCKKIAQLTKVIYALNSKNDEHEANIHALKEAHQEEIDQIISETKEKILQYKNKAGEELDLRLRLQILEEALEQDKKLKEEALADFATYRLQAEDRELRTKTEHAERITILSKEMLDMKKDFENQLQSLKQETDNLRNECRVNGRGRYEGKERVKENHNLEVQALLNELGNLKLENQKITEEYAENTDKLEAYEKEKEVLKKTLQQSVEETLKHCQQKELEHRQKLETDLDTKGQKINELMKYSQKMQERVQDLERQLGEARHETLESQNSLKKIEEELTVAKERLMLQENEIHTKSEQMKTVLMSQSEAIQEADELKSQINQLQQKIIDKPNHGRKGSEDSTVLKQQYSTNMERLLQDLVEGQQQQQQQFMQSHLEQRQQPQKRPRGILHVVQEAWEEEPSPGRNLADYVLTVQERLKKADEAAKLCLEKAQAGQARAYNQKKAHLEQLVHQNDGVFSGVPGQTHLATHDIITEPGVVVQQHCYQIAEAQQQAVVKKVVEMLELGVIKESTINWSSSIVLVPKLDGSIRFCIDFWKIALLKQTLEQQTNNYKEVLKMRDMQSSKEKEKLLQDLQDNIKQNQMMKAQLEASHQKTLKVLEKKKNQELKEAQERFRKECNESFKREHQSHRLEIQALEKRAKQELHRECERLQKQHSLPLDSVRAELSEQKISCASHKKQIEELLQELKHLKGLKKQQEESKQNQLKTLNDELGKCCSEISALKKENSLLKETMELLSTQAELQKHEAMQLQEREKQQKRLLEEDLKAKQKTELESLRQDHKKEIQNLVVDFSSAQAHLQAKIVCLETELKEVKAKPRKWEPRPEDLQLIGHLQHNLTEKDQVIKRLMDEQKLQPAVLPNMEMHRNRSFSCNPNHGCLTATIKRKKMEEAPSRVISVPNLASYENFSNGDLILKSGIPPIAKSPGVEQKSCTRRTCQKSAEILDSKPIVRFQGKEISKTKESQDHVPKRPDWFTKYFSF